MATTKKAGSAPVEAAALPDTTTKAPAPVLKPFQWIDPHSCKDLPSHTVLTAAGQARDIAGGVAVLLQIFEQEDLDADFSDDHGNDLPRILTASARSSLQRMAITSLRMLDGDMEKLIDWARDQHGKANGGAT